MKLLTLLEHSLIVESKFDNLVDKNLQLILDSVKPYTDVLIKANIKAMEDKDIVVTKADIESIELGVTIDLILAVSKYIKSTDIVKVHTAQTSKGVVTFNCYITRDDAEYFLNTEMIYAGGYNIQQRHYRYLVKSNLPKINNSTAADKLIDKQKRLNSAMIVRKNIAQLTLVYNREIKNREIEANKTEDEIIPTYLKTMAWDSATSPFSKTEFDIKISSWKQEKLDSHYSVYNQQSLAYYIASKTKEYNKQLKKLQDKLNALENE